MKLLSCSFSVYENCIDVTTHYRMDCNKKEIYLTVYSLKDGINNKFLDIKNEFFLAISAYNAFELKTTLIILKLEN